MDRVTPAREFQVQIVETLWQIGNDPVRMVDRHHGTEAQRTFEHLHTGLDSVTLVYSHRRARLVVLLRIFGLHTHREVEVRRY